MLCRKGWKAVFVFIVAAGLWFRAEAELYSDLSIEPSSNSTLEFTLDVPDFALINHHSTSHYLGSNSLPDLLQDFPPQNLFTHRFADTAEPKPDLDTPAWDNLWRVAPRVPINAVPEPSTFALLAVGALLLGSRRSPSK